MPVRLVADPAANQHILANESRMHLSFAVRHRVHGCAELPRAATSFNSQESSNATCLLHLPMAVIALNCYYSQHEQSTVQCDTLQSSCSGETFACKVVLSPTSYLLHPDAVPPHQQVLNLWAPAFQPGQLIVLPAFS